jgi:TldD protein
MFRKKSSVAFAMSCLFAAAALGTDSSGPASVAEHPILKVMSDELAYTMENLVSPDGTRPYYLGYTVYDETRVIIDATLGALRRDNRVETRDLNIDLRVGDYKLDNTHQLRGGGARRYRRSGNVSLSIEFEPDSIRHAIWYGTDREFKRAAKRLAQVKTNLKVKVEEEDPSDDFTREESNIYLQPSATLSFDCDTWRERTRRLSAVARDFPSIYASSVTLGAFAGNRYMVTSEGTKLQTHDTRFRITLQASTKAEDGMDVGQSFDFNTATEDRLPSEEEIKEAFLRVIKQVLALREAPLVEPYAGPAILRNRASGVFFHEIFGHRIEGHRQKDVTEGQTYTKKIGEQVLPEFISVHSDPTTRRTGDVDLRGYYLYDDEGVKARDVRLVENGVLETFLLSRSPVQGFTHSNGHGRRASGFAPAGRQSNLIVESSNVVPFEQLRELLIEECKRQDKPYGLLFEDISGGFTQTGRRGPQTFKVLPIVVYRVYVDGRPDELVRGADIVGTPLTCFEKIIATGDDVGVFNGSCGAESGWVPVSAVSPSILVSTIEIEKRQRAQSRPPILPSPLASEP